MDNRTETLLELYFSNDLSEKEAVELRTLIENDPEAAVEWKWQQQIAQASRQLRLTAPVQRVAPAPVVPMWRSFAKLAAAVVVLIAAVTMIDRIWNKPSVSEAVVANFEPYPNDLVSNSRDINVDEQPSAEMRRAFELYDDPAQYPAAAEALGMLAARYPDRPEYSLYQGVALLGAHDYPSAITALEKAAASNTKYHTPALYYLGLAQSGAEQYPAARQSFERYLADKNGVPFRKKAEKMLKVLPVR